MAHAPSPDHRLIVIISIAAAVLAVVVGVGVYGLVRGPAEPSHSPSTASGDTASRPEPATSTATAAIPSALPRTSDPVRYARSVAEAIFTWDTMSGLMPADHASVVIADADPSGHETNGLVSDLATYLPTVETWQQLRAYRVTQSLRIEQAYVPPSWPGIVASAGDQLGAGTVAVTIEGVRRRAGVWYDKPATAEHDVSFTVFVACRPAFDRCHVLRLSQLDNPLP
jgi:hypothetical protein